MKRDCVLCECGDVETEKHFLLHCPYYTRERIPSFKKNESYIPGLYCMTVTYWKLTTLNNLSMYIEGHPQMIKLFLVPVFLHRNVLRKEV